VEEDIKAPASVVMWLAYLAMIYFSYGQLQTWSILLAFVLMMPLMGAMAFMWNGGTKSSGSKSQQRESEKRKRERLDAVLRDLSDDELLRLKERLLDGSVNDDILYERMVGDDGELVEYRKK
jgi:membrane protein implicated in regulation of membrane protease activity